MPSFPGADAIIAAYEDQCEALSHLLGRRAAVVAEPSSRFHGLSYDDFAGRLERDREELDLWAAMMLVAGFEATVRADMQERLRVRTKDAVREPLRDLDEAWRGRVRLDDILSEWEHAVNMHTVLQENFRRLLRHRHWLAHGRYWTNKHGLPPSPSEVRALLRNYVAALQASVPDFPLV